MIEHNGTLPRELQAILAIENCIKRVKFPLNRISLTVEFDYAIAELTSHKVDVEKQGEVMCGTVLLKLNGLCLWQDPAVFYMECIPHELAHIMDVISTLRNGEEVDNVHGESWRSWVARIDSDLIAIPHPVGDFDFRPIKLLKGGIPVRCECDVESGMQVFSSRSSVRKRLLDGEEVCKECGAEYKPLDMPGVPQNIVDQVDFIRRSALKFK